MPGLGSPARFFRKLDIYQDIRKGTGVAGAKQPWRQEAVFLQWAHKRGYKRLGSYVTYDYSRKQVHFAAEVSARLHKHGINPAKIERTIRSLFFKELVELRAKPSSGQYYIRLSRAGFETGQVLAGMNSSAWFVRRWYNAKYGGVSLLITLAVFFSLMSISFIGTLAIRTWLSGPQM